MGGHIEPSRINVPHKSVNMLPMITTTAETVIPVEQVIEHLCEIYACLHITRRSNCARDSAECADII